MSRTGTALTSKTSSHRYRYGAKNEVTVPVTTTMVAFEEIAEGDIILCGGIVVDATINIDVLGVAYPASVVASADGALASAADMFLGVALDSSANGDSDDILIATSGVFEFNLYPAATVTFGEAACVTDGTEGASMDCYTVVQGNAADTNRIGTIVSYGTTQSTVLVRIQSKVINGYAIT